jgi:2-keto-3-deoxy-L-rhamnonate aldolase RhmA
VNAKKGKDMIFKNRVKGALKEGKVVFGPMVSEIRTPGIAVLFAQAGFDLFFIDMEHSCLTTETMSDMILAARAAGISPIVRPSSRRSSEYLSRPLDSGADGLLVPQIQTREDVENIVKWCRYFPEGERGMALSRQHTFFEGGQALETTRQLNEEILLALQIEHRDAIERLPELLSVPGIDVAFVGPADLSASLGKPGQSNDPKVMEAIHRVIEVSRETGIIPGIHTDSLKAAKYWIDEGMKMIGFYTDIKLILEICKNSVKELRGYLEGIQPKNL